MLLDIYDIIVMGLATATVSVTVAQSKLFRRPRGWLEGWKWGSELVNCPYCLSHWVAGGLTLATGWHTVSVLDSIVLWLAITAVGAIAAGIIGRLYAD